jgi:uncharacterized protein
MIVDLRNVSTESKQYAFHVDQTWWEAGEAVEPSVGLHEPIQVRVELYKAGAKYVLEGFIKGALRIRCDRCLESYRHGLESRFRLILKQATEESGQPEIELLDEDMQVDFINGTEVDLGEIVRQQVLLNQPMKSLCRDDCRGICPGCGQNLNTETCTCKASGGHPAFLKLKNHKV